MACSSVMCRDIACYLVCGSLAALITSPPSPLAASDGIEFFETRIRPVLVEHCYECHSAQAVRHMQLKGGLQLDTRELIRRGGESGPAVVPGSIEDSLLVTALRHQDGLEMPPQGRLPERIVNDFVHWISSGAPDPRENENSSARHEDRPSSGVPQSCSGHWAFQTPRPSPAPDVSHGKWCKTVWDSFILAEMEKRGLVPVRGATKRELIRRVTFDLIGMPPTVEEVDAFLQDDSPAAFDGVVDRLLASPHYGERWARFWLDVARYADDKALAYHNPWPYAYRYRDWVVRALNQDMPYDRFVRLQLAGDVLPEPVTEYATRLAGLGFQGLGALYHKGSVPAQVTADELDDRIDTLSRGLLGLTVACARCHDHKYDPISTQDYYSLAAAYNGATWTEVAMAAPEVISRYKAWEQDQKRMEADLNKWLSEQGRRISRRELDRVDRYLLTAWRVHAHKQLGLPMDEVATAEHEELQALILSKCAQLLDKADPEKTVSALANWIRVARETMPEAHGSSQQSVTTDLAGKVDEESFSVSARLRTATDELASQLHTALQHHHRLTHEASQRPRGPDGENDKDKEHGPELTRRDDALLKAVWLDDKAPFSVTDKEVPELLDAEQRADNAKRQDDLARHRNSAPPAPPLAHGVSGGGAPMRIHIRGNVEQPGDLAPPRFLPVLQPAGDEPPTSNTFTRLDLADAVCAPGNPLTARVIVNRVWQHHFGQGMVATTSNFGQLGERPSHPELLDTLAVRFMESGWSLKWLHRQIVGSATYQLSSQVAYSCDPWQDGVPSCERQIHERNSSLEHRLQHPPLTGTATQTTTDPRSIDPDNRLLWRFAPRRLGVEAWRDAMLAVSGRLDRAIGGPAVGGADADHVRRTLYSTISRREPNKMLVAFDFPDANVTSERRDVTTVPQQQLFVLNSQFILQSASDLAARLSKAADDDRQRIELIYRLAFARLPTAGELRDGQEFLAVARNDPGEDQLTEWEQFAHAILAANEFSWID